MKWDGLTRLILPIRFPSNGIFSSVRHQGGRGPPKACGPAQVET